jgi:hypothetical protein
MSKGDGLSAKEQEKVFQRIALDSCDCAHGNQRIRQNRGSAMCGMAFCDRSRTACARRPLVRAIPPNNFRLAAQLHLGVHLRLTE